MVDYHLYERTGDIGYWWWGTITANPESTRYLLSQNVNRQ